MSGGMRTSILAGAAIVACYGLVLMERKEDKVTDQVQSPTAGLQHELSEESDRAARLAEQENIVRARIDFTRRVARELIARRLTLLEAATQLRNLDSSLAPVYQDLYGTVFLQLYPGRSEGERYCQRAMAVVDAELTSKPPERTAILRRLNDELHRELGRGMVQLAH
jgi:hypothetical protein